MTIIAFLAGFAVLNVWLISRRDTPRAQRLRSTKLLADDRFVYLSLPGLALLFFGFGFMGMAVPMAEASTGMWLTVVAGVATIFGLVFSFWGIFGKTVPRFAQPRWTRDTPGRFNQPQPDQQKKNRPNKRRRK